MEAAMVVQPSQANVSMALTIVASAGFLTIMESPLHQTHLMTFMAA